MSTFEASRTTHKFDFHFVEMKLFKFKVKEMAKVTFFGHIRGLVYYQYVIFSFHGHRTIIAGDVGNETFDLDNSRSRS